MSVKGGGVSYPFRNFGFFGNSFFHLAWSLIDETSPRCAASQKHNDQQNLDHDDIHQQYLDDPDDEPSQSLGDPDDLSISTQSHTIQCSSNSGMTFKKGEKMDIWDSSLYVNSYIDFHIIKYI